MRTMLPAVGCAMGDQQQARAAAAPQQQAQHDTARQGALADTAAGGHVRVHAGCSATFTIGLQGNTVL